MWSGGKSESLFLPSMHPVPGFVVATLTILQVRDETRVSRNITRSFARPIPGLQVTRNVEIPGCHSYVSHKCFHPPASLFDSRALKPSTCHCAWEADKCLMTVLVSVYEIRKKHSLSGRASLNTSSTWYWTSRTAKNKMSSGYSPSKWLQSFSCPWAKLVTHRADQFIQQALTQGGKVLVHCNGA